MISYIKKMGRSVLPGRGRYIARVWHGRRLVERYNRHGICLDIGSGVYDLFGKTPFISFDIRYDKLIRNPRRIKCVGDAQKLPFKDNSVNCVISTDTIGYIKNLQQYFKEIHRINKFGGIFILTIPIVQAKGGILKVISNYVPEEAWTRDWEGTCNFFRSFKEIKDSIMDYFTIKEVTHYHKYFLQVYLMIEKIFPIILRNRIVRPLLSTLMVRIDKTFISNPKIYGGVAVLLVKKR